MRPGIVPGLLLLLVLPAGCASMRNTAAQDLGWERWRTCDRFSTIALERIEVDGRLVVRSYERPADAFTACVRETAAAQAGRGVAVAAPSSLVRVKFFGCTGGPS
jgi:hypothetical protein